MEACRGVNSYTDSGPLCIIKQKYALGSFSMVVQLVVFLHLGLEDSDVEQGIVAEAWH